MSCCRESSFGRKKNSFGPFFHLMVQLINGTEMHTERLAVFHTGRLSAFFLSYGRRGCTNPSEKGGSKSTSRSRSPGHARLRQCRIVLPDTHVPVGRRPRRNGNPCSNHTLLEARSFASHISHLKCFVIISIVAVELFVRTLT